MIFKSDKWELDTEKIAVTNLESGETTAFHEACIRLHLHHREEYSTELLQKTVDEDNILQYLEDLAEVVRNKIDVQTEMWCEQDKEYLIANESGNILRASQIKNAYKFTARDSVYAAYIYV